MVAGVGLTYNSAATAEEMANSIFGDGVSVVGATYSGQAASSAIYSNGDTVAAFVTPGDTGVILSTGFAERFTNDGPDPNIAPDTSADTTGIDNDSQFDAIAGGGGGGETYDAAYMVVDFVPDHDVMTMQFVFASEEYPEYTNSVYNDMVGVWVNGTHVPLSIASSGTTINSVNQTQNINLYNDNTTDQHNTEMDGFTVTMTLTIPVNAGEVNSIKIGVADVSDSVYDSNLLIAAGSVQTELVAEQDYVTMNEGMTQNLAVLDNDINNTTGTLVVTHINGNPVVAGDTIFLKTGQSVTLKEDGTFDITTDDFIEVSSFTYEVDSVAEDGTVLETDVGFVTIGTIPCFVAGSMIETPDGERAVETLAVGDLVITRDDGPQPLRWTGRRSVPAVGKMAPIRFAENALGEHGEVMVSPLHRVLVKDAFAELMFGEAEVLVAAKDLVNDRTIRPAPGGHVEYVHLLFDRHQVVYAEGLPSESFLPGPQTTGSFEADMVAEITAIFPELDLSTGEGYGPAARPMLKKYEAAALRKRIA